MNGKKISAQAAGMAIAMCLVWAVKEWAKVEVPDPVVVSIGTLASIVVSILTPDEKEDA